MVCDKCGREVSENNSVIEFLRLHMIPAIDADKDRHLYPEVECEGSPSRVKMIKESGKTKEQYFKDELEGIAEWLAVKRRHGL